MYLANCSDALLLIVENETLNTWGQKRRDNDMLSVTKHKLPHYY